MQALPIFFNIAQRLCIVIGGGDVATRKVLMLRKAQGQVTVISPVLCDELRMKHIQDRANGSFAGG